MEVFDGRETILMLLISKDQMIVCLCTEVAFFLKVSYSQYVKLNKLKYFHFTVKVQS